MTTHDKISPEFRERLDALAEDESLCVLVTLASPEVSTRLQRKREYRQRILAEVEVYTANALDELRSLINDRGGEILAVSKPLSIITIRAGRELVERLEKEDLVASIIENQEVHSLGHGTGDPRILD